MAYGCTLDRPYFTWLLVIISSTLYDHMKNALSFRNRVHAALSQFGWSESEHIEFPQQISPISSEILFAVELTEFNEWNYNLIIQLFF